jgi:hypothetical protein
MEFSESGSGARQPGRRELRASAMAEMRALGDEIRNSRRRPDVYALAQHLGLSSQAMAQRLLATRRLDERLALLIPQGQSPALPPTPDEILRAEDTNLPPPSREDVSRRELSAERLDLVARNIAAAIECSNQGALLGKEELQGIIRAYGEDVMRFGLKFRASVPVYLIELLRTNRGTPMQLAATAILVWSELENYPLSPDARQSLSQMRPVRVQTLDDPQETADLLRYALTATKNS